MPDPDLAPETHNSEQEDAMSQAHNVARQAREHAAAASESGDSRKPKNREPIPSSEQDVVDHMRDMTASGRIDMDAYAGEPDHDDEAKAGAAKRAPTRDH